jgi:predicted nucleic acid-binding protein
MHEKTSTRTGIVGADTSFLIDFFRGDAGAVQFMRSHSRLLRVSELVIYEFLCGNLSLREQKLFFDAMQSFTTVEFNREAAILASELYRKGKQAGTSLGHQDSMIAGSYLAHGVNKIVTRNAEHFSRLKEIEVISYAASDHHREPKRD